MRWCAVDQKKDWPRYVLVAVWGLLFVSKDKAASFCFFRVRFGVYEQNDVLLRSAPKVASVLVVARAYCKGKIKRLNAFKGALL